MKTIKDILIKFSNNELLLCVTGLVLFVILIFFTFFYDIGLNGKYFVKRDFSRAFLLRQTGNCEEFIKYVNQDWYRWISACYEEKRNTNFGHPIKEFKVKEITINGDRSFLQVELKREEDDYVVNYEMKRIRGKWFIDQQMH